MKTKHMSYLILSFFIITNLFISCDKENEPQTGDIVFWKFTDLIDCGPIEVKITLNSKSIGTLNLDFQPYDSIPNCGAENCLTVNKPIGEYNYKAECYCGKNKNLIGYWTGTLNVKQDSCTKIFFDYNEITKE